MTDLEKQMAEALRGLLNDTQHARHDDCHDGPCPVREARDALAKFDAPAAEQAAGGGEIDALRRDAERYRAVRDDDCHPYGICIWVEDDGWAQDARKPDVVDAAIDAALAAAR